MQAIVYQIDSGKEEQEQKHSNRMEGDRKFTVEIE